MKSWASAPADAFGGEQSLFVRFVQHPAGLPEGLASWRPIALRIEQDSTLRDSLIADRYSLIADR